MWDFVFAGKLSTRSQWPVGETGASCCNLQLKSFFCETYDRCIIYVKVYVNFIIRVNKIYHMIDIPFSSYADM